MFAIIASAALAAASIPYSAADELAARSWIARSGHPFDAATIAAGDLGPLVQTLAGARVIGVGEATHGTHQDEAFKAELIKALVRAGAIVLLAIECNRAAGAGFDRYVRFGEGDPAALMRSPSFFGIWRNDAFADLLIWLRAWNQATAQPVRIIGIDDQDVGVDAENALGFMARHDQGKTQRLRAAFGNLLPAQNDHPTVFYDWVSAVDRAKFISVLTAAGELDQAFDAAPAAWKADPYYGEARYAAKTAHQGLQVFSREYKGASDSIDDPIYRGMRDRFMAANLIEQAGSGRAALWAHDLHVAAALPIADEKAGYRTLGMELRAVLGDRYRSVGFTWSRATVHLVNVPAGTLPPSSAKRVLVDVPLVNDRPGDWGHVFDPLPADGWWIDLKSRPHTEALDRWGSRSLWRGWAGWLINAAHYQDDPDNGLPPPPDRGFDVLVWFRKMGAARGWPSAQAK